MSTVEISNTNPIALDAVVSQDASGGYLITVEYSSAVADDIVDSFASPPSAVTVNVTSTTVPSGHHLGVSGDGSWTTNSSSSLTGEFDLNGEAVLEGSFTVLLVSGSTLVAKHDPRLTVKPIAGM